MPILRRIAGMLFVAIFGPGPLAGTVCIGFRSVGFVGKLFAEALEEVNPGPIEAALEGTEIEDPHDPVEVGLVARSFDSCLVCTVHAHDNKSGKQLAKFKL